MPRYFFHRTAGVRDLDHEGLDLPELEDARYEAVAFASDTLKDRKYNLWEGGEVCVEVADAKQQLLFTVSLRATIAPEKDNSNDAPSALTQS